ncbi:MAG: methyltransferase, partial [Flavobacterium sp.]|nr:methyltransferase [Flavobacterium sp.]
AISLAHRLIEATVFAMDVSADALQIAKYNADANHVKVNFILDDILQFAPLAKYDIIVSNPPYVRYSEKSEIRSNVLDNEPHLALFVADDDPLLFYRRIAELAVDSLNENGALFFEINQYLAAETISLLTSLGYRSELRKDMYGNDRMVKAMLHHS